MDEANDAAGRQKVLSLIKGIDYALLTTRGADGAPLHARPMALCTIGDDGELWFFTRADSRKVAELRRDPALLVGFADPKAQHFVTIAGEGEIVTDGAEKTRRWREIFRAWFPGGPEDDAVVMIRVRAQRADYWDTPTSPVVYAFGYLKAVATGTPTRSGEIGSVDLSTAPARSEPIAT